MLLAKALTVLSGLIILLANINLQVIGNSKSKINDAWAAWVGAAVDDCTQSANNHQLVVDLVIVARTVDCENMVKFQLALAISLNTEATIIVNVKVGLNELLIIFLSA